MPSFAESSTGPSSIYDIRISILACGLVLPMEMSSVVCFLYCPANAAFDLEITGWKIVVTWHQTSQERLNICERIASEELRKSQSIRTIIKRITPAACVNVCKHGERSRSSGQALWPIRLWRRQLRGLRLMEVAWRVTGTI